MTIKSLHPKCEKCGRSGILDKGLCAICFKDKYGRWSEKFMAGEKEGKKKK